MISVMVAPSGRCSIATTWAVLLSRGAPVCGAGACWSGLAAFLRLGDLVTGCAAAGALSIGLESAVAAATSGAASAACGAAVAGSGVILALGTLTTSGAASVIVSGATTATASGTAVVPGTGCATGSLLAAPSRRWIACQIRATATFRSVNFLTGFSSPNGDTPAKPFQISIKRLTGHSAPSLPNSFWLLNANPPVASSLEPNTVMLLFSSMVNVFILIFLSSRSLAVTTSITRMWLESKHFLETDQL